MATSAETIRANAEGATVPSQGETLRLRMPGDPLPTLGRNPLDLQIDSAGLARDALLSLPFRDCFPYLFEDVHP